MDELRATLYHARNVLLIKFGRMTITMQGSDRDSVNDDLEFAHFIPVENWEYGNHHDVVRIRRKEHRFDMYKPRQGAKYVGSG